MNTFMMLMVAYNGKPDLDVKTVADNHFNLTEAKFLCDILAVTSSQTLATTPSPVLSPPQPARFSFRFILFRSL